MSLRIRLRRVGRKKQPSYRIVVANSAAPRDGAYVDEVGFYNPRTKPAELRLNLEKVETWVSKGATLSTTADSLYRKAKKGGDDKVALKTAATAAPAEAAAAPAPAKRTRKPAAPGSRGTPAAEAPAQPEAEAAAPAEAPAPAPAEEPAAPAAEAAAE